MRESEGGSGQVPIRAPEFRRQFVLGSNHPEIARGWDRYVTNHGARLTVHSDLPCIMVDVGSRSLTLLGYVLDPQHPERDDQTILKNLLCNSATVAEVISACDALVGRWAIIYAAGDRVVVFHDAAGMRPVYYARDEVGTVWCGSSPCLLSRVMGREPDRQNRQQLFGDGVISPYGDHFWPGDGSAFVGIQRLLPNHYLDIATGQVSRFWPQVSITAISQDEGIARCAAMLTGAFSAAAARFPLAFAITAGLDSRLLLAASRGVADQLSFYTLKKHGLHAISPDIRVPKNLLGYLGFAHRVITVKNVSSGLIHDTIHSTVYPCHQGVVQQVEALIADPLISDGAWVTVNGNVCEIARCFYKREAVTPGNLARESGMGINPFAADQFGAWYETAQPAIEATGINPWDLFYWEQKMGGWLGSVRTEFDLVEEVFTPFNCRALIECMLGVDESLRSPPSYKFFYELIATLWPEVLEYPINPKDYLNLARNRSTSMVGGALGHAKTVAQRAGVYPLYVYLKRRPRRGNEPGRL